MTREDAKEYLTALWVNDSITIDETIALETAIKALEQEPVLDKIRAEIVEQREFCAECNSETDLGIAVEIIDKYMSESEG